MSYTVEELDSAIKELSARQHNPLTFGPRCGNITVELDGADAAPVRAALVSALKKLRRRAMLRESWRGPKMGVRVGV
jgi:hypothetical protein